MIWNLHVTLILYLCCSSYTSSPLRFWRETWRTWKFGRGCQGRWWTAAMIRLEEIIRLIVLPQGMRMRGVKGQTLVWKILMTTWMGPNSLRHKLHLYVSILTSLLEPIQDSQSPKISYEWAIAKKMRIHCGPQRRGPAEAPAKKRTQIKICSSLLDATTFIVMAEVSVRFDLCVAYAKSEMHLGWYIVWESIWKLRLSQDGDCYAGNRKEKWKDAVKN